MKDGQPEAAWFQVEESIEASAEEIFSYLTDPQRYVRWMGIEAELDARPGGLFRLRHSDTLLAVGEFVAVEPFRRLVFTWGWQGNPSVPPGSSTVEITLHEEGDSTLVRLRHSGLPDDATRHDHREGWVMHLQRLGIVAQGGDPGPNAH